MGGSRSCWRSQWWAYPLGRGSRVFTLGLALDRSGMLSAAEVGEIRLRSAVCHPIGRSVADGARTCAHRYGIRCRTRLHSGGPAAVGGSKKENKKGNLWTIQEGCTHLPSHVHNIFVSLGRRTDRGSQECRHFLLASHCESRCLPTGVGGFVAS